MYGKNVIKINYCDVFYVIYVLNSTQLLCLHCNYVVVFSYRNTGSNKGIGLYLSTPPMSEHRSALSTSGNMSNLRSARYTVVDLSKKKKKTSNKLLTRTALTALSLNLIFVETNGPRWEKKCSA